MIIIKELKDKLEKEFETPMSERMLEKATSAQLSRIDHDLEKIKKYRAEMQKDDDKEWYEEEIETCRKIITEFLDNIKLYRRPFHYRKDDELAKDLELYG